MKNLLIILAAIFFIGNIAFAQDVQYSQKFKERYEKAKLNSISKSATIQDHLWLTPLLVEAKRNWDKLTPEVKDMLKGFKTRPTLTDEQIYWSYYFDFHYTLTGADAVDPTDVDVSGVPDFVEDMAVIFDEVYLKDSLNGFTIPPPDGGLGGSDYYDVYIHDIGYGLYGFVAPENLIGDNPNSSGIIETNAYTSYMGMNNDYSWAGSADTAISVTAAHEFMHSIQMGYEYEMGIWLMEMTATWSEDFHYPGYDDNLQYLMNIFGTPDIALNLNNDDDPEGLGNHWYGAWIFAKYLTEHTNDNIIKNIFERTITVYDIYAIDDELIANWSTDFWSIFEDYLIANVVMHNDPVYAPYTYLRADVYGNYIYNNGGMYFEDNLSYTGTPIYFDSEIDGNGRLMRLSADYFDIDANQNFSITMAPDNPSADLDIVLLKYNITTNNFSVQYSYIDGGDYIIEVTDQTDYEFFELIVERFDEYVTDTISEQYYLYIDVISGIKENSNSVINIYPNPATDYVVINFDKKQSNISLEIKDLLGKVVYEEINIQDENRKIVNTSNLNDGIYILNLKEKDNLIKTEKLIIIH